MRTGLTMTMIFCLLPVTVVATTLRLSTDIDLLVLDGKKVSSLLLRGADSIELDNGPHQLVFRVEKTIRGANHEMRLYISPPLVVSFNTRSVKLVNFSLPSLDSWKAAEKFDSAPAIVLLDGEAAPIPLLLDILPLRDKGKVINYERETVRYNKAGKTASLPLFAPAMADDSALLSGLSELDTIPSQSQTLTEQRLKFWFEQADPQTRDRFLQWAKQQPPS
ncbi:MULTISPECIES: curli synthesis inhibitor [unclassified Enterobacter]|uniref:curli synthesis inhibitor n=1 Tax=unclassified Enterobacter TaxID=2608935 RepID=UPI000932A084|nr:MULTISPECIES: DUF2057 family protein [unclassified Enterobacter]